MRALTLSVVGVGFLISASGAGLLGTFLADREPPISIISADVLTPEVRPGGQLVIRFAVFRHRSCGTHVDRLMRDSAGNRQLLDDVDLKVSPGPMGPDTFTMAVPVPVTFVPGPARYISSAEFVCNIVHDLWPIRAPTREMTFMVAPF